MTVMTRRQALLTVASGVTTLAGCTGREQDNPTHDDIRLDDQLVENYEIQHVRNEDSAVLFAGSDESLTVTDHKRNRDQLEHAYHNSAVVVSEREVTELTFNDVPEADRLASFAAETDFESSSLVLLMWTIEACYELHIESMTVEANQLSSGDLQPDIDVCQSYRPADVVCKDGEMHTVGYAIRLPIPAEKSLGMGSGWSRSCSFPSNGDYFVTSVTPVDKEDSA